MCQTSTASTPDRSSSETSSGVASRKLGNGELAGRNVVEQLEQHGERVVFGVLGNGEEEDLRIEVAQHALDVVRLGDAHDTLEPMGMRLVPHGEVRLDHDGVRIGSAGVEHSAQVQQRKLRRDAHGIDAVDRCQAVGATLFRVAGARRVVDLDDERDPVALGDRLAHLAHEWGS